MGWENPKIIQALDTLVTGTEPDRAAALRKDVVRTLQSELPMIPIIYNTRTAAFSKRIENARLDPLERTYGLADMRWTA